MDEGKNGILEYWNDGMVEEWKDRWMAIISLLEAQ
jgi:hypothetical protein